MEEAEIVEKVLFGKESRLIPWRAVIGINTFGGYLLWSAYQTWESGEWPHAMAPDLVILRLIVGVVGGAPGVILGATILGTLGIFCLVVPIYLRLIGPIKRD